MTTSAGTPAITDTAVRGLSARRSEPAWLLERRLAALRTYEALSMPDPLDEEWRRTDISGIDFEEALAAQGEPVSELRGQPLPSGVVFADLHTAAREHEALVRGHLHSLVRPSDWKFAALQAAAWQGGAFVYVPANAELSLPLAYLLRQMGGPAFPHLLVIAEPNSSLTLVQDGSGQAPAGWSLVSGAVEIICRADSRVRFADVQQFGSGGVVAFSTVRARLERGAEFSAGLIGLGARLDRTRLEVSLEGEGARAELYGLSYGEGKQHFDYITLQDHLAPRTSSDLLFKAALDGESSEVWTGTVRIQKGAGASEANQASRNLLLSDRAKAAPIPVLEIEAYDVLRCSHGATAGPLDEDQLFYLESRGLPPAVAERLLVEAFFREVIDRLPEAVDRDQLDALLERKLGGVG